jgi:hypothetical protein
MYGKGKIAGVGECGVGLGFTVQDESIFDWIDRINLGAKRAGDRSAGNLHALFGAAGAETES